MQTLDWMVMVGTLAFIVSYGMWRARIARKQNASSDDFMAGSRTLPWWTIGFSIMATQASAITFLSTPGQGFNDGMQFVQFYFGMPIAMLFLAVFVLPFYYRYRITTAYEYLEQRFDLRMRSLTAVLFLIQRGISASISIYAPSIILCAVFGWNLALTNFAMAAFVVLYTTSGGSTTVSKTQQLQMGIMLGGLVMAFLLILYNLPKGVGLSEAWEIAGITGKTQVIDWHFDWNDRYNFWSGTLGATFLFLSYFGTDQSQVGRYLSGKTLKESRIGLIFNGIIKIPMQFLVLSVGVMVFVFFQFQRPPLHFSESNRAKVKGTAQEAAFVQLEARADSIFVQKTQALNNFATALKTGEKEVEASSRVELQNIENQRTNLRKEAETLITAASPDSDPKDKDYVFIYYILNYVPSGLVGLMLAMAFCASWGTTSSELTALAATSVSDIYRRSIVKGRSDAYYLKVSKWAIVLWGVFIMVFATYAGLFDNLIQAVNMVGSIFYGTILGIFFTGFFLKKVGGRAVFYAAVITQAIVAYLFFCVDKNPYLWYNPLGCGLVMLLGFLLEHIFSFGKTAK
ncbi:MAG: sodium:solute symporter [Saprospiraceae bacterium]|nr:sodium:solute symporter [Saprospiraceae bacterium]